MKTGSARSGKAVHDLFAPTVARSQVAAGSAATPAEPYTKATVVLRNSQVVLLDRMASDIRSRTGAAIARAELIRAMIDALAESKIDLSAAASEAALKALIRKHIKTS